MFQDNHAETFQDRFKDKNARTLTIRSALLFQESNARVFPKSNVPLYLVKAARMFPSRSAEVFPANPARTLHDKCRDRNVNLFLLRSAVLFPANSAGTFPSSSAAVCLIRTVPVFPSRSAALCQGSSASRWLGSSARLLNHLMKNKTSAVIKTSTIQLMKQKPVNFENKWIRD
jgi:hypothetical protein